MAYDIHLKFEGGVTVKGSSQHKKHKDEVKLLGWAWGVSNFFDLQNNPSSLGGKARVENISVSKFVDGASNALLEAVCTGARFTKVTLSVSNATGEQTDFITIVCENVAVVSLSTGGSDGDGAYTENLSLHFSKFKYTFQPQTPEGKADGGKKEFAFDMQQVAKS